MHRAYILIISVILTIACSHINGAVVSSEVRENRVSLSSVDSLVFILDSLTVNRINYFEYNDKLNELTFINTLTNTIMAYDCISCELKYTIDLKEAFPKIQGYSIVNRDTMLLHSYPLSTTYITDSQCQITKKIVFDDRNRVTDLILPDPFLSTSSPIKYYNQKIVTMGLVADETKKETANNRPTLILADIQHGCKEFKMNYPIMYSQYNWGGGLFYRLPYFDITDEGVVVISYSASHDIYTYDLNTSETSKFYAGSNEISYISSFNFPKDMPVPNDKEKEWYMNNPSFEGIFYDRYKQRYYRIARLPQPQYRSFKDNRKPVIIIVLDCNFSYLGEYRLPDNYTYVPSNSFVTDKGLNIQVLTDNEDELFFYCYEFNTH